MTHERRAASTIVRQRSARVGGNAEQTPADRSRAAESSLSAAVAAASEGREGYDEWVSWTGLHARSDTPPLGWLHVEGGWEDEGWQSSAREARPLLAVPAPRAG